ncbi:MAG: CoA transferase [Chloroflexi bacterium]|nr:CoA transferase [Chloroflexota bacterium]
MLQGTRVIDLSDGVAGAYAARMLALLGADVVKVEPPSGDPTRSSGPRRDDSGETSALFASLNPGKRSAVIDAETVAGRGALLALVEGADIVIESAPPGWWAERGLDFAALTAAHPGLVACSVTPFGQSGPRSQWRMAALTAFAAGGQMMLCGDPESPPLKTAGHQAYTQAGLHAFAASLTALLAARRDGHGEWIDISVQEVQAASLEAAGPSAMVRGLDAERVGNQARAVWGIYPCADGYVGVASMARQTGSVYRCIGHPELTETPIFADLVSNPEANELVATLVTEWTTARTAREIFDESQRHRAPFSLIPTPRDLLEWPPLVETAFWTEVDHPRLGRHALPGLPFRIDGERGAPRRAPLLGEHTAEVLAEAAAERAPAAAAGTKPRLPFEGLRVLDLTQVWAGPYAARFLADMGADVIHIEGPSFPDAVRGVGRGDDPRSFNKAPYFNEYNRNKRGLAMDLHRPEGIEAFRRLVPLADVVIENWSVGVAERLGIGFADLQALNPGISLVQMPGFSQTGPEAERVGFGPTIEQMGGLVALQGYEDGPPHKSGISYGDPTGGITAAGATAAALLRRQQTGRGSHVVVSQRDNIIGMVGEFMVAESAGLPYPMRPGNRDPEAVPHNVYRTRDDSGRMQGDVVGRVIGEFHDTWLAIAVDSDEAWAALRSVVGDARLDDPAYRALEGRRAHEAAIDAVIEAWARDRDPSVEAKRLQAAGVSASPVMSALMLVRDEHLAERGYYQRTVHPEAGEHAVTHPVWRLQHRPLAPIGPAPCFGEHNAVILGELAGYSAAEIEAMAEAGVLATVPLAS